jgi:hypothetical protein
MSIKANYPDIRPTLNLDFANTKRLDPRITFTRTTTGTYVGSDGLIKTAAIDEARFDHNPATCESLGLLAEEARTNLLTYSEEFDNAAWTKSNMTLTADSVISPSGLLTADKLSPDVAGASFYQARTVTSGTTYTYSAYMKKAENNFGMLRTQWDGNTYDTVNFDLANGTTSRVPTGVNSVSIDAVGNGWYRCVVNFTPTNTVTTNIQIKSSSEAQTSASLTYSGTFDGSNGIFAWGPQLEVGAFPTSYIPTSGSTVTRGKDDTKILVSDFDYVDTEYTLCVEFEFLDDSSFIVGFANDANYRIFIRLFDTDGLALDDRVNGVAQVSAGGIGQAFPQNTFGKVALGYKENDLAISLNGQTPETDSSVNVGINATELRFTKGHFGGNVGTTRVKCLQYYPLRLSNTVLQGLTS